MPVLTVKRKKVKESKKAVRIEPVAIVRDTNEVSKLPIPEIGSYVLFIPKGYKKVGLGAAFPKWLSALESGRYKQGSGMLAVKKRSASKPTKKVAKKVTKTKEAKACPGIYYCCLGVLSKIQGRLKIFKQVPILSDDGSTEDLLGVDCDKEAKCYTDGHSSTLDATNPLNSKLFDTGDLQDAVIYYCSNSSHKSATTQPIGDIWQYYERVGSLAEANDAGMTFKQIACVLRKLFRV